MTPRSCRRAAGRPGKLAGLGGLTDSGARGCCDASAPPGLSRLGALLETQGRGVAAYSLPISKLQAAAGPAVSPQHGDRPGVGPIPGSTQWGCARCSVIPLSYVTGRGCHGHGGAARAPAQPPLSSVHQEPCTPTPPWPGLLAQVQMRFLSAPRPQGAHLRDCIPWSRRS